MLYFNPVNRWPSHIIQYYYKAHTAYSKLPVRSLSSHRSRLHVHFVIFMSSCLTANSQFQAEEKAEILPLKHGVFLFKFPGEQQCLSILRLSLWLFDGEPIIMLSFRHSLSVNEYDFTKILYWVRIHELPMNVITMDMASTIGSHFGKLVVVDTRHTHGNLGEFFRLQVEIKVSDPLLRCVIIGKLANDVWDMRSKSTLTPKDSNAKTTPYGPWMRAPMETKRPAPYQRQGIAPNPGVGISDKELDELDKIADELGVDSTLFAYPNSAPIDVIAHLILGSLAKVNKSVGSSSMLQVQGIEPEATNVLSGGESCLPPRSDGNMANLDDPDVVGVVLVDPRKADEPIQHPKCCMRGLLHTLLLQKCRQQKRRCMKCLMCYPRELCGGVLLHIAVIDFDQWRTSSLMLMRLLAPTKDPDMESTDPHHPPNAPDRAMTLLTQPKNALRILCWNYERIHGYDDPNVRMKTWQLLDRLKAQSDLPWLVGGDINEILHNNENQDCRVHSEYMAASDNFFLAMDTNGVSLSTTPTLHGDYYKFDDYWTFEPK
ncbi:hypothetical protein V6N13_063808 [Hibiscus sabdariffa]